MFIFDTKLFFILLITVHIFVGVYANTFNDMYVKKNVRGGRMSTWRYRRHN